MQTPGCRLEVCDLAKSYGAVTAADGVDLDLAPGELPIGFQLIGKKWHEADILGIGQFYEKI